MVADHLGGTYECITDDEIALVPKTNVSERDIAQLDRLLRQKPNASTRSCLQTTKQQAG